MIQFVLRTRLNSQLLTDTVLFLPHLTSSSSNCGITAILLVFIFTSYLSFYLASLILLPSPRLPQLGLLPSPAGREPAVPAPSPRSHPRTQAPGWAWRTAAVGLLPQIYSTGKTHTHNMMCLCCLCCDSQYCQCKISCH